MHPLTTPISGRALRALTAQIDAQIAPEARDEMLRGAGRRLARLMALPEASSLAALDAEINAALRELGWGSAHLVLDAPEQTLIITHHGLPTVGAAGEPSGYWLAAMLEGLYETWLGLQQGADPTLSARRDPSPGEDGTLVIRYRRR